jgi:hypothetical protein
LRTKRRLEITIDTDRVFVIRRGRIGATAWCARCDQQVRTVTPDEAAFTAHASTRAIYRRVESRELHFLETPEEPLLVCLNSLSSVSFDN